MERATFLVLTASKAGKAVNFPCRPRGLSPTRPSGSFSDSILSQGIPRSGKTFLAKVACPLAVTVKAVMMAC